MKHEIYYSLDIEADGPIPGPYSMLSFAMVVVDPSLAKGTDVSGTVIGRYTANLDLLAGAGTDPDTTAFWAKNQEAYAATRVNTRPAEIVMPEFVAWASELAGSRNTTPVCAAYPGSYDFMFLYWYLIRFAGSSPFGFQCLDIKTLAMAALGCDFKAASKRNFPRKWFFQAPRHTHVAMADAEGQAVIFCHILRELRVRLAAQAEADGIPPITIKVPAMLEKSTDRAAHETMLVTSYLRQNDDVITTAEEMNDTVRERQFMGLREFLELPDPDLEHCSISRACSDDWVRLYDVAKESYETYGDDGPPVGSRVVTHFNGHGGEAGVVRTFGGIFERDPRYFFLMRKGDGSHLDISLVLRKTWWRDIRVLSQGELDDPGKRKKIWTP